MSENKPKLRWIVYRFSSMDKNKMATINPKRNDHNFHENIVKDLQRISKLKSYIDN